MEVFTEYRYLGNTGIKVSKLCFGSLTVGPLQENLPVEEGSEVIAEALNAGVNFIDTAQYYRTYKYIKRAVNLTGIVPVIASKCFAYTREDAKAALFEALEGTGKDFIDIFMLHEQESEFTLKGHFEAVEYFLGAKAEGLIKAIGLSSHHIAAVEAAVQMPEIEIIHPLINKNGMGIQDGDQEEMCGAIRKCSEKGKGIYAMKIFGGGHLLKEYGECLAYIADIPEIDSIAIGMKNIDEVRFNIAHFNRIFDQPDTGKCFEIDTAQLEKLVSGKKLHIEEYCRNCGKCIEKCGFHALYLKDNQLNVNHNQCVLCGYCAGVCPYFALKVL